MFFEIFFFFSHLISFCFGGTINAPGTAYTRWPTNIIPYKYMSNDATELAVIKAAADQISFDTGGCVNFTLIQKDLPANQSHLVIQNRFNNPASNSDFCFSYPGYTSTQNNRGQVVVMFSRNSGSNAVGGCLENIRDAMRILMNAIGVRNEFQRKDRNDFMIFPTTVDRNNLVASELQPFNIFSELNKYTDSLAINAVPLFDKDSVTMVSGTRFAETSTPVFTTVNNAVVGQQSRLSKGDCQTVRSLYSCANWYGGDVGQTSCGDPYSAGGTISLLPNPAIVSRSLQCTTVAGGLALNNPLPIGQFVISGTQVSGTPTNPPTIGAVTSSVPGLQTELVSLAYPVQQDATRNTAKACAGGTTACIYSLKFTMNRIPNVGVINQQVVVKLTQGSATNVIATLTATINLNCAPVFQTITAAVGVTPGLASPVTFQLGTDIVPVPFPAGKPFPSAPTFQVANGGGGTLSQYIVNYNMPKGVGDTGDPNLTGGYAAGTTPPKKVFVNCILGAAAVGGAAANPSFLGGTTVIGTVTATDPEGGPVSYYAYSGLTKEAVAAAQYSASNPAAATPAAGELHSVTKEGVISISAIVPTTGVLNAKSNPGPAATGDPNGGEAGAALPDATSTAPIDMFIVAVDSLGASSVLQARFFVSCGEVVT